jgi:tight adherence protein B
MSDRASLLLRGLGLTVAFLLLLAPTGSAATLNATLSGAAKFPQRSFVFTEPAVQDLTAGALRITENGKPVSGVTLTPISGAGPNQFGVELVINQSTQMSGQSLTNAMNVARLLATLRRNNQKLGMVTYDATTDVALPLSTNPNTINGTLATSPLVGQGAHLLPAISLGVQQLTNAHVADGAVIVLTDGVGDGTDTSVTPSSITAAAQAAGIRIFTIGIKDRHYNQAALAQLASSIASPLTPATGAQQLNSVATGLWSLLTHDYLVGYHSSAPFGHPVTVSVSVNGAPGTVTMSYTSPPAPPAPVHHAAPPAQHHPAAPAKSAKPKIPPLSVVAPLPVAKPHGFWTSYGSVLFVALAVAALLGCAVSLMLRPGTGRELQARVSTFLIDEDESDPTAEQVQAGGRLAKLVYASSWWPGFVETVRSARMRRTPIELVRMGIGGSLLIAVAVDVLSGSAFLAFLSLALGPLITRTIVRRAAKKQRMKFAEQLPSHLQDLAGAMRAGRSFVGSITAVSEAADEPIRGELERALADERLGMPVDNAIHQVAVRMQSEDMDQVALVASLNRSSGSNVAEALDRVADGARERFDLRRELAAMTGQARISSWVLSALPIVMLIATSVVDPAYAHPMFHSIGGIIVLVISAILIVSGWFVMQKIVAIEV